MTDEHVFPNWLLKHFRLRDERLTLLNGTTIPYRQLTIRCCLKCNRHHLGQIEARVRDRFYKGYKFFSNQSEWDLYLWLVKILVAILIKESQLVSERRQPETGRIVESSQLRQLDMLHMLLQIARGQTSYVGPPPGSILVFPALEPTEPKLRFDFLDDPSYTILCVYLGRICVVASLLDRRALVEFQPGYWRKHQRHPLHPLQFREVAAHFLYKRRLLREIPGHTIASNSDLQRVVIAPRPLTARFRAETFMPWQNREYLTILGQLTGCPMDWNLIPEDRIVSWLRDADGKPVRLTFDQIPEGQFPHDSWVPLDEATGIGVIKG